MSEKMIKITFPDNSVKEYPAGSSALDVAESIHHQLALRSIAATVNNKLQDMDIPINEDATVTLHTFDDETGKAIYWHSSAHLMADAVKQLFPDVKVTIGPAIEEGFYYDFDREASFTDEELIQIEDKMKALAKKKHKYERREVSKAEAVKIFTEMDETYKLELLEAIPEDEVISIYQSGDFVDLCRGPHIKHTGKIKAIKLLKTSGAYWKGDENNKMLKRIYGITFPAKKELHAYMELVERRKKSDHRKLGKDLDLFSISDEIGAGLVLWHPNGAMIRSAIETYWRKKHYENGYKPIYTPHIGKADLWKTSGHLDFYADGMFAPMDIEGQDYYVKPMNCPFHIQVYNSTKRSYRELPVRYCELGTVYRYERSGTLHGLMRVRGFTQDDAHIICTPEQLEGEVEKIIDFSIAMLKKFGFEDMQLYLSTKPEKSVGEQERWDQATNSLKAALEKHEMDYEIDEGGGAFYGPKIDIKVKDALNRSWQLSTIQFDFNLPERFKMEYVGADNSPHQPFMIHRALLGSLERFFGILIEHHSGSFPLWLSPVQVKIIPVSDNFLHYAERVLAKLQKYEIRAEIDYRNEKVGYKIREAELQKVPFMFIVGEKEEDKNEVSIRRHKIGDMGKLYTEDAIELILKEQQ